MTPTKKRLMPATRRTQIAEWRCLSFLEAREMLTEGKKVGRTICSSGAD
jgi:hypothetical protein